MLQIIIDVLVSIAIISLAHTVCDQFADAFTVPAALPDTAIEPPAKPAAPAPTAAASVPPPPGDMKTELTGFLASLRRDKA